MDGWMDGWMDGRTDSYCHFLDLLKYGKYVCVHIFHRFLFFCTL